jgi:hypothetical protein
MPMAYTYILKLVCNIRGKKKTNNRHTHERTYIHGIKNIYHTEKDDAYVNTVANQILIVFPFIHFLEH